MKFACLFSTLSLIFFCSGLCSVLAQAPQTPKMAFALIDDGGNSEIYLMNPDGTDQVKLTHNKAFDVSPMWSPTGEQILFVSNRDGIRDLYLMDADGKNVKRVFGKSEDRRHPTWSPDGETDCLYARRAGQLVHLHRFNRRAKRGASGAWQSAYLVF